MLSDPDPIQSDPGSVSRRDLLVAAAGALTAAAAGVITPQNAGAHQESTRRQGELASELGTRSPSVQARRGLLLNAQVSRTPLQDLDGTITPADLHFERHHGGIPTIDPAKSTLLIHGLVERPLMFTLADLRRSPSVTRICFLECSGMDYRIDRTTLPAVRMPARDRFVPGDRERYRHVR